ncbi:glycosyltransferase [Salinibacter ruber]|uniref:glycosyltransferase n=1 Tax=Salinibacter ruber TaxID=146919 RepID=UPI003C6DD2AB
MWAETARERGYDVHVTALKTGGETLVREEGYPFHEIADQERGRNPIAELRLVWRLYRLFSSVEPDLVHLITLRSLEPVLILNRPVRTSTDVPRIGTWSRAVVDLPPESRPDLQAIAAVRSLVA